MWTIYDWAGNVVDTGDTPNRFATFEDAWSWLYDLYPDDEDALQDFEVVKK